MPIGIISAPVTAPTVSPLPNSPIARPSTANGSTPSQSVISADPHWAAGIRTPMASPVAKMSSTTGSAMAIADATFTAR